MLKSINLIKSLLSGTDDDITNIVNEPQNMEYEGTTFTIHETMYRSRLAKRTPKKKGYFVVFWEKDVNQRNQAYAYSESPDKIMISIIDKDLKGQFIFPKSLLLEKRILRTIDNKGKMAIRVYPSWEKSLNNAAKKTQAWQAPYFINVSNEIDWGRLTELYFS
ncbi:MULTISPECIES: MepB family protein [Oceanobacillus]|uniref:MepB protein n=1 Tax=Oceanobacillus oncorhynchi TaxID=545501 RepID=A0A0A1MN42_9BACI|nr:MepB family protein [Oceanobacillus oncorhynchi]UUI39147.1 MepB family protein [Oceanobacillus oncorhynchi]CEI81219.1 MepB protein [Oceanobacillus oncorhynchi]